MATQFFSQHTLTQRELTRNFVRSFSGVMWQGFKDMFGLSRNRSTGRSRDANSGGARRKVSAAARGQQQQSWQQPLSLPDFWHSLTSHAIAHVVTFATRQELNVLEFCCVDRITTFCRVELLRRGKVHFSMAQSARAFAIAYYYTCYNLHTYTIYTIYTIYT